MKSNRRHKKSSFGRCMVASALAFSAGVMSGCGDLLEVDLPGELTEEGLIRPEMSRPMVFSAIADFECAYAEFTFSIAGLEDAMWESTGWFAKNWSEYRVFPNTGAVDSEPCGESDTAAGFFESFQSARFQAEQAYEAISGFSEEEVPDKEELLAIAATYAGLTYQTFGEHWCEMAVDVGPLMTPEETLGVGEQWFDRALQHISATGDIAIATTASVEQLVYLGRARVHFALGNFDAAAADARQVQPGFVAYVTRSGAVRKRWNQVYHHLNVSKFGTVPGPVEFQGEVVSVGYRNLTVDAAGRPTVGEGVADPRVPVEFTGQVGSDGVTPHWVQLKYRSQGDPIPFARWAEAQLILAEIEGGQAAIDRINALRDVHGLPNVSYIDASDADAIQELIIEERRREFFFEGRFHADKLRYDLWFPESRGFNHKGIAYGPTTCLPLSEDERILNPNIPNPNG